MEDKSPIKLRLSNNTKRNHFVIKIKALIKKSLILLSMGWIVFVSEFANCKAVTSTIEISSTHSQSISGQWKFKAGDDLLWASNKFDDSLWQDMMVPQRWSDRGYPETGQFAWYRLNLQLSPVTQNDWGKLGVEIGKVLSAYEIYAGGELLGGVGVLPPNNKVNYDETRVYSIPLSAISNNGKIVLALRVWGGTDFSVERWGGGTHAGQFRFGLHVDLLEQSFLDILPGLTLFILFFWFGLYHLYLYMKNNQLHGYLWYAITALDISLYGLMSNQIRYQLEWDFINMEKIELSTIYVFPAVFIQMIWSLFSLPIGRILRAYQFSFLIFAFLILVVPGLKIIYSTLHIYEAWSLLTMPIILYVVIKQARIGNPEAKTVLIGVVVFLLTGINDVLIDLARWDTMRMISVGFIAIMLSMAISLANKFTNAFSHLESEVKSRTQELKLANKQLAETANRDMLTGLLNRRGFSAIARIEIERSLRTKRPFSIILSDIDKFKLFNDTHGHACGDYVLQEIASLISDNIRDIDSTARWGGEEFILILPEAERFDAVVVAEKIRKKIEQNKFMFEGEQLAVTMTFGVSVFNTAGSLEQCIQGADEALYRGKNEGRNRVVSQSL